MGIRSDKFPNEGRTKNKNGFSRTGEDPENRMSVRVFQFFIGNVSRTMKR